MRLTVGEEQAGERLDAYLGRHVASRSAAQRLVDSGAVTVDGRPRPRSWRVSTGELVEAALPEGPAPVVQPEIDVVYEDDELMVLDKPPGLVTHPAPGHEGPTVSQALAGRALGGRDPSRAGIVHRLDRDTSGLMLVSKTEAAHAALQEQIRRRAVTREYLALVEGAPESDAGTIDAPLGRDRVRRALQSTRTDKPRAAVTHFRVVERFPRTSLLELRLETGRTHQIRAHLAEIGHPVCGDRAYGGSGSGRRLGLERQFLHAARLMFSHPSSGEPVTCESKPPADLRHILSAAKRDTVSDGPDGG